MLTDSYNLSHQILKQNTDWEVSNIINRNKNNLGGMILYGFEETVRNLFSRKISQEDVNKASFTAYKHGFLFPIELFTRVVNECDGYIPLKIDALLDGLFIPTGTPFCQISNTVKGFGELVSWWEGMLLHAYFPSGCATQAYEIKKYLGENGDRVHSFGFRGHRSLEDAYWAGTAWNLFFDGTDDFHTLQHFNNNSESIPALAHKVVQNWKEELSCYENAVNAVHLISTQDSKVVSIVIDTYDSDRFISQYLDKICKLGDNKNTKCMFRLDSGTHDEIRNQAIEILKKVANYKLNHEVIISNDVTYDEIIKYDSEISHSGFDKNKIVYGIGGGFYNHLTRNWAGWAMKTSYSNYRPTMKLSPGGKQSIPGVMGVELDPNSNKFMCYQLVNPLFPLIHKGTKIVPEIFGTMRTLYCYCPSGYEMSYIYTKYEKEFVKDATLYYKPFDYQQIKSNANNALLHEIKGVQFDSATDIEIRKIKCDYLFN